MFTGFHYLCVYLQVYHLQLCVFVMQYKKQDKGKMSCIYIDVNVWKRKSNRKHTQKQLDTDKTDWYLLAECYYFMHV